MIIELVLCVWAVFPSISGLHFSITPPNSAFFLYSPFSSTNFTQRALYLQGDCPASIDQHITVSTGNRAETARLYSSIPNLHCAVTVKLVEDVVKLDRPYVDVIALADLALLSFLKQSTCVTVQITSPSADTVTATCRLTPFEEGRQSCLIRLNIPYTWFGAVGRNSTRQFLSLSHTVSSTCNVPFYDRPQTPITVLPYIENAQAHTLAKNSQLDLSLLSRANISLSLNSLNSLFVHLSINKTEQSMASIEIRLFVDARLELVTVAPLSTTDWDIRAVSPHRTELYTAIICTPKREIASWDGYLFSLLVKMRGSAAEKLKLERGNDGAEAVLHWEIYSKTTGNDTKPKIERVATKFRVTPDVNYALVPVAKNTDIVNTGILSGRQSSTSMRVYTVTRGGKIDDVTSKSHCISAESKVLKTSPTCTTVYVDGSELRGMMGIKIHVHYEKWTTSVAFTVWYPKLPITISLRDSILNSIDSWQVAKWKELNESGTKKKRAAKQFSCARRYQQTEVKVLASFQVADERTGERTFLSGSRDLHFDVTSLSAVSIHSADRSIATVQSLNDRVLVQAVKPGNTRIVLKRQMPGVDYGFAAVMVSEDPVTVTRLTAVPVVELDITINRTPARRAQYSVVAGIETTFGHRYQHGSFFYQLHYSDETAEPLDDVLNSDFNLGAISTDERSVALSHKSKNAVDMIALDDLTDPSVELELRAPAHCIDPESPPMAFALIPLRVQFNEMDSSRVAVDRLLTAHNVSSITLPPVEESPWRMDTVLALLLILIVLIGAVRMLSGRVKGSRGYEKLVAPLLSRLSSSSSGGRDEDTKEWVWLSKARIDSNSIGSRYSQKSTINVAEQSSPSYDENTHTSISYRGSEISVFISPTPVLTVHADRPAGAGGSWRSSGRSRTRAARHALVDSSSDHNLARVVARSGSWRDQPDAWQPHTWNTKRRPPTSFEGMRESVA